MGKKGEIYLTYSNGTTTFSPELVSPGGRELTIGIIQKDRRDRTANNSLKIEIVGTKKKKFTLQYEAIDGVDLGILETFFELEQSLILEICTSDISSDIYDVWMMPYDKTRWVLLGNGLWKNVTFVFEEI